MKVINEGASTVVMVVNGARYELKPAGTAIMGDAEYKAIKALYPTIKELTGAVDDTVVISSANPIEKKEPKNVGKNKKSRK